MSITFSDTCRVWQIDLSAITDAHHVLDAIEQARAARMRFDRDRRRFIAARVGLRTTLGALLGREPADIRFETGPHGRPSLVGSKDLEFNVSHSADLALIAVTRQAPLGIDVEAIREIPRALDLARRYLHPEEFRLVESAPAPKRSSVFLTCWTRKEAVLKSTGVGLTLDTRKMNVGATREEKVLNLPDFPSLRLFSLSGIAGFVAACAAGPGVQRIELLRDPLQTKNRAP